MALRRRMKGRRAGISFKGVVDMDSSRLRCRGSSWCAGGE